MKNDTINYDSLLQEVEKLIYKLAWRAANRYGMSFDECKSECYQVFLKAAQQFNPKKAKFSTFLQCKIQWHFLTLVRQRMMHEERFPAVEINEETIGRCPSYCACPVSHIPCLEAVEKMSSEAQEIIELLIETPKEILDVWEPCSPKEMLRRAKACLQNRGRTRQRLEEAHKEIEWNFRSIWGQELV